MESELCHSFTPHHTQDVRTNHVTGTDYDLKNPPPPPPPTPQKKKNPTPLEGWMSGEVLFCQMGDKTINPLQCTQSRVTLATAVRGETVISTAE